MIRFTKTKHTRLIYRLQSSIFPDDELHTEPSIWWIGWDNGDPIAFCGITIESNEGFLCRSGVIESHRGQGLQKRMIKIREKEAKKLNLESVWTYVVPDNPASLNSLIRLGYKAFVPFYEQHREESVVFLGKWFL